MEYVISLPCRYAMEFSHPPVDILDIVNNDIVGSGMCTLSGGFELHNVKIYLAQRIDKNICLNIKVATDHENVINDYVDKDLKHIGQPILAKYKDGYHYRGKILPFTYKGHHVVTRPLKNNVYKVIFVDYGNINDVVLSDMCPMSRELGRFSPQVVPLNLSLDGLRDDSTRYLDKLVDEINARVAGYNSLHCRLVQPPIGDDGPNLWVDCAKLIKWANLDFPPTH